MRAPVPRGVTLVELLVTVSLMALIAAATMAALTGGLKVWQRTAEYGTQQQGAVVVLERVRRDVQSARWSTLVPPKGRYDEYAFGAVGVLPELGDAPAELGRLGYYHDSMKRHLCRSFVPYRLMKRERLRERCQVVLEGVQRVRFRFQDAPAGGKAGRWRESWDQAALPASIRVELELTPEGKAERGLPLSATFSIIPQAPPADETADANG